MTKPANVKVPLEDVPDFLGVAHRVEVVSNLIQGAQEQIAGIESRRILNNHQPSDKIPPVSGEENVTYKDRLKDLRDGINALWTQNEDIKEELIAEAVRRKKAVETMIQKQHEEQLK